MKIESFLCFFSVYPLVTNHGWLENPLRMEVLKRASPISMVHGFQPAMFDDTGGYQPLKSSFGHCPSHTSPAAFPCMVWARLPAPRSGTVEFRALERALGTLWYSEPLHNYVKSAFLLGQLMISMPIFNSYAARNYGKSACLMVKLTVNGPFR